MGCERRVEEGDGDMADIIVPQFDIPPTPERIEPSGSNEPLLTDFEYRAAYVLAASKNRTEAAKTLGCSPQTLRNYELTNPAFRMVKAQATREISERVMDSAADYGELFDSEIVKSFSTLVEVRDDPLEKGDTRIRSAMGMLDRAPSSPKVVRENKVEQKTIIQIPVQHLKALEMAASDIQDAEIIEMLEDGRDEMEVANESGKSLESKIVDDYVPNVINVDEL